MCRLNLTRTHTLSENYWGTVRIKRGCFLRYGGRGIVRIGIPKNRLKLSYLPTCSAHTNGDGGTWTLRQGKTSLHTCGKVSSKGVVLVNLFVRLLRWAWHCTFAGKVFTIGTVWSGRQILPVSYDVSTFDFKFPLHVWSCSYFQHSFRALGIKKTPQLLPPPPNLSNPPPKPYQKTPQTLLGGVLARFGVGF